MPFWPKLKCGTERTGSNRTATVLVSREECPRHDLRLL